MPPTGDLDAVRRAFAQAAREFETPPEPAAQDSLPGRRSVRAERSGQEVVLTLVSQEVDGEAVLRVEEGLPAISYGGARRRGPGALGLGGDVVLEQPLAALDRNQIGTALTALDRGLTPKQELRTLGADGKLEKAGEVRTDGRILLLVHGTFSRGEMFVEGPQGKAIADWARGSYDQVLAWDHPTLSVSPVVNARRLALALAGTEKAAIDVVCHSRGGLVTRWWLEAFDRGAPDRRRVVFVACPLAGTGLAAPPRLKAALSLVANLGKALAEAGRFVPFATFVTGVFQIVSSITSLVAKTPALDAAVALIPGLAGQSRVGNNFELLALRERATPLDRYFAIQSNFESEQVGWRFWRAFRNLPGRIASGAADLVFEGHNDLVVDSPSMTSLADKLVLPKGQVLDFGTNDRVHHCNYFDQPETLKFLQEKLG
jgi:hypothetical protein